jgi:hypothetical protein
LKPRSLQVVNDCFKNESNTVVGVFLQRLIKHLIYDVLQKAIALNIKT